MTAAFPAGPLHLAAVLLFSILLSGCARASLAQPPAAAPVAATAAAAAAAIPADTAALRRKLDSIADLHRGVVGYSIIDLETGSRLSRRGDESFPTASLIKVPILVTIFDLVSRGQLSLDDRLTLLRIDKVPGSGILQHMHDGLLLTVGDATWLMSTISDNTATNLLLDRIIIRRVWNKMDSLGLTRTRVHSKSFLRISSVAMDSSVKYGLGVTTPNEMARLFELLARGQAVNAQADSQMLSILEHNDNTRVLLRFAPGVRAAHKTGETDQVRTDCGLLHLRSRIVVCVLTKDNVDTSWVIDNEAWLTIGRIGAVIVRTWGRR